MLEYMKIAIKEADNRKVSCLGSKLVFLNLLCIFLMSAFYIELSIVICWKYSNCSVQDAE